MVELGREIGEGPTLRLGGGALVKACAVRWRLSKTMGTLKATVDIPSYNRHTEKWTMELGERPTRTTGTHLGTGCFAFAASWPDCINNRRSPSRVVYCRRVWEVDRVALSAQIEMHVIFMYSICDGRQNAQ